MRSRLSVKRAVRRPMRAAAAAASQPAWPAPTMRTSKVSDAAGDAPGCVGDSISFDFSGLEGGLGGLMFFDMGYTCLKVNKIAFRRIT